MNRDSRRRRALRDEARNGVGADQRRPAHDDMNLNSDDMLGTLESVVQFNARFVDKGVEAVMPHMFVLTEGDEPKSFVLALPDLASIPNEDHAWQTYVRGLGEQFGGAIGAERVSAAFWTSEVLMREPTTGDVVGEAVVTYGMKRNGFTVAAFQNISRDPDCLVRLSSPYINRPGRASSQILAAFFDGVSIASQAA